MLEVRLELEGPYRRRISPSLSQFYQFLILAGMVRLLLTTLHGLASACFRDREKRSGYNSQLATTKEDRLESSCLVGETLDRVLGC